MFARFVKNVKFFEKSLIQKFLFLCNFKLFLHKINPKSHQTPCQTTVAESGFELKILLIFLNILFSHLVKVYLISIVIVYINIKKRDMLGCGVLKRQNGIETAIMHKN